MTRRKTSFSFFFTKLIMYHLILFTNMTLSTLLILAVCRTHIISELCMSFTHHRVSVALKVWGSFPFWDSDFFFVLWQDKKHLSPFLYWAQNLPSFLFYQYIISSSPKIKNPALLPTWAIVIIRCPSPLSPLFNCEHLFLCRQVTVFADPMCDVLDSLTNKNNKSFIPISCKLSLLNKWIVSLPTTH